MRAFVITPQSCDLLGLEATRLRSGKICTAEGTRLSRRLCDICAASWASPVRSAGASGIAVAVDGNALGIVELSVA